MHKSLLVAAIAMTISLPLAAAHAQVRPAAPQQGQWRTLSGSELESLALAHRLGGILKSGDPFLLTFSRDGTATLTNVGSTTKDRWSLRGYHMCFHGDGLICWAMATNGSRYIYIDRTRDGQPLLGASLDAYLDSVPYFGRAWTGGP